MPHTRDVRYSARWLEPMERLEPRRLLAWGAAPHLTAGQTCLYSVARSEQSAAGTYAIGLRAVNSLSEDEWAPFAPPPAPGLDLGTKLAYLIFAIAGAATIVLTALTWKHPH